MCVGTSYGYANRDRREYFSCGLFGAGSRHSALGCGPAARALGLLLSEHGAWCGGRIAVVRDTADEWSTLRRESVDVGVEAELLLLEIDGFEWLETRVRESDATLLRLGDFAVHLQRTDVAGFLDATFGETEWRRRHGKASREVAFDDTVLAARRRGLRRLYER